MLYHFLFHFETPKPTRKHTDGSEVIGQSFSSRVSPAPSGNKICVYTFWGWITTNKASGGYERPAKLFQVLKGDAVKVLYSILQQIWKSQQWPQDWKRSAFIPVPKKGNAKECSNYCTIALILHASKVMLKILQGRLQQYVN